jgi:hypothetical protein
MLYISSVLGIKIQTTLMKELKIIRGYEKIIPFLALCIVFKILFGKNIEHRFLMLNNYIFMPNKMIFISFSIVSAFEKYVVEHPNEKLPRIKRTPRNIKGYIFDSIYSSICSKKALT